MNKISKQLLKWCQQLNKRLVAIDPKENLHNSTIFFDAAQSSSLHNFSKIKNFLLLKFTKLKNIRE